MRTTPLQEPLLPKSSRDHTEISMPSSSLTQLPYPALIIIANFLNESDAYSFSQTCKNILDMVEKSEHKVDAENIIRKLIKLGWDKGELRLSIYGKTFALPQLPITLPQDASAKIIRELLSKRRHKDYRLHLDSTLKQIEESTSSHFKITILSLLAIGGAVGLYFYLNYILSLPQFLLSLGNICCLDPSPCIFDSCKKLSCEDVFHHPHDSTNWLNNREDSQSLNWATDQCKTYGTQCNKNTNTLPGDVIVIDGKYPDGITMNCDLNKTRLWQYFSFSFLILGYITILISKTREYTSVAKINNSKNLSPELFKGMIKEMRKFLRTEENTNAVQIDSANRLTAIV